MSAPAGIMDRVAEALTALYRHPERTLLPWYRYTIYTAFTSSDILRGHAARAWLDILAARHALFCWPPYARNAWSPAWIQPEELLALAEQLLRGTADRANIKRRINHAYALADVAGESPASPYYCEWCVFEAALRALNSAWMYDQLRSSSARARTLVEAINCSDDASSYAAVAIGGGTWHPLVEPAQPAATAAGRWEWRSADVQLRRAVFWEWWLRDAIPAAWRLV